MNDKTKKYRKVHDNLWLYGDYNAPLQSERVLFGFVYNQ